MMILVSDYRKWLVTLLDALGSKNWNLGRSGGEDWNEVKQSQAEIVNFVDSIVAVKDAEIAALKERQITPEMWALFDEAKEAGKQGNGGREFFAIKEFFALLETLREADAS